MARTRRMRGGTAVMPNGTIVGAEKMPPDDDGLTEEQRREIATQMRNSIPSFSTPPRYGRIIFTQENVIKRLLDMPVSSYGTSVDVDEAMKIITNILTPLRPPVKIPGSLLKSKVPTLVGGSPRPPVRPPTKTTARPPTKTTARPPSVPSLTLSSLDNGISQLTQLVPRYSPTAFDSIVKKYDDFLAVQQGLIDKIQDRIEELKTKDIQSRQQLIERAKMSKGTAEQAKETAKATGVLMSETLSRLIKYRTDLGARLNELREKFTELQRKEAEEAAAAAVEEAVEEEGENSNYQEGGGKRRSKTRVAGRARTLVRKYMKKLRHGKTLRR